MFAPHLTLTLLIMFSAWLSQAMPPVSREPHLSQQKIPRENVVASLTQLSADLRADIEFGASIDPQIRTALDDERRSLLADAQAEQELALRLQRVPSTGVALVAPGSRSSRVRGPAGLPTLLPERLDRSAQTQMPIVSAGLHGQADAAVIFDIPVTYNARVQRWLQHFQGHGRGFFRRWLERSGRFLPALQAELVRNGLPQDLAYIAMVESGLSPHAVSHAGAMGLWQFIKPTGARYDLRVAWWIDERKDFAKATRSAIRYMRDLYQQFGSWYLVAASYNMGENGVRRLIRRHQTNNFWELADRGALPEETTNYVPKILAATLIAKAPALYGFRDLRYQLPYDYEFVELPGGFDLSRLARELGVSDRHLKELNPELLLGLVPAEVRSHRIRVPRGAGSAVRQIAAAEPIRSSRQ